MTIRARTLGARVVSVGTRPVWHAAPEAWTAISRSGPPRSGPLRFDPRSGVRAPPGRYARRVRAAARTTPAAALAAGLVLGLLGASPARAGVPDVDPFVGTGGRAPWFSGNTTPAAARPFGMVQLGPDTTSDGVGGRPSTTATGYAADDPLLRGFSPTHLSGVGCPAFGDVPLLPVTGPVPDSPAAATVGLGRQDAGPGWYRTTLDNGVTASLAAADRAGLASFTFPAGPRARLLVKAAGSLAGVQRATVSFPSAREVAVSATSGGFCGSPGHYRVHVLYRTLFEVDLGAGPPGVRQRVQVVVGGRRVGVRDDLLVLQAAEEVGERAEGESQLAGDPTAGGDADAEQELEDQPLHLRGVQARLFEAGHRLGPERDLLGDQ